METPTIRFEEMTDDEFDVYLAATVVEYSEEGARATGMPMDEALEKGRAQLEELLPDGRHTEGQLIRKIVTDSGEILGRLWIAIQLEESPPRLFIYDIAIDESGRGRGVGSAAMLLLEEEASRIGAEAIRLHVFTHNDGAVRLYTRLGYEVTFEGPGGMQMTKVLAIV